MELQGGPDFALSVEQFQPQMSHPPEWGAGSGKPMHRFVVRNGGPVQAVNVSIDDIPLPMSEAVKRGMEEEVRAVQDASGESLGPRQQGWDIWTITFDTLTGVAIGQESPIKFKIDNMGPLQSRDICYRSSEHGADGRRRSSSRAAGSAFLQSRRERVDSEIRSRTSVQMQFESDVQVDRAGRGPSQRAFRWISSMRARSPAFEGVGRARRGAPFPA